MCKCKIYSEIIKNKIRVLESDKKIYQLQFERALDNLNQINIERYSNLISQTMYGIDLLRSIQYEFLERKYEENEDTKENNL